MQMINMEMLLCMLQLALRETKTITRPATCQATQASRKAQQLRLTIHMVLQNDRQVRATITFNPLNLQIIMEWAEKGNNTQPRLPTPSRNTSMRLSRLPRRSQMLQAQKAKHMRALVGQAEIAIEENHIPTRKEGLAPIQSQARSSRPTQLTQQDNLIIMHPTVKSKTTDSSIEAIESPTMHRHLVCMDIQINILDQQSRHQELTARKTLLTPGIPAGPLELTL